MTLLSQLERQVERVRQYQDQEKLQAIDREAGPAHLSVERLRGEWQKLMSLATIAPELTGRLPEQIGPLREQLAAICREWDSSGGNISLSNVTALQRSMLEKIGVLRDIRREATQAVERVVAQVDAELAHSEFLARELALTAPAIGEAQFEMRTQLAGIREVLAGRREAAPPDWTQLRVLFDAEASPRACLRLAQLPEGTVAVMGRLLTKGELTLDECRPEDLTGLFASPVLARLCRLTLPKGS